MSSDHVAKMSPLIRKAFEFPGDGGCATFEIVGLEDAWAQVMKGTINMAYPFDSSPGVDAIAADLPGVVVESWEEHKFVTYSFDEASPRSVAKALDHLFTTFFSKSDYSVEGRFENMDE